MIVASLSLLIATQVSNVNHGNNLFALTAAIFCINKRTFQKKQKNKKKAYIFHCLIQTRLTFYSTLRTQSIPVTLLHFELNDSSKPLFPQIEIVNKSL